MKNVHQFVGMYEKNKTKTTTTIEKKTAKSPVSTNYARFF